MATRQPGASTLFPGEGQTRAQYGRDWGNYVSVVTMPNGSGNILAASEFKLEAGDRCYLSLAGGECEYLCVSPGAATLGNAVWVPSSGQGPWSSVLYVDGVRGSDTTGQRGNANRPFATIQAAINAASTNDVVQLAPQLFTITASLTRPATLTNFVVQGYGKDGNTSTGGAGGTFIRQTTAGQAVFNLSTNLGLTGFTLRNVKMRGSGVNENIILADGSVAGYASDTYLVTPGMLLDNTDAIVGRLTCKYVFNLQMFGGNWSGNMFSFTSCAQVTLSGVLAVAAAVTLTFDGDDISAPSVDSGLLIIGQSNVGGTIGNAFVTLSKQGRLFVDDSSLIGGVKGSGLTLNAAATKSPSVVCAGNITSANSGVLDFATAGSELPDTATVLTFDFRGTRLWGMPWGATSISGVVNAKFKVTGAAANFQAVKLDMAEAFPGCTFTADAAIHMTARGSDFPQAVYTTPGANGDIIPPYLEGTVDLAAGGTVAHTWAGDLGYVGLVRTGVAPDVALLTSIAQGADAVVSVKAATGFTTIANAVGGNTAANWRVDWK